MAGRGFLSGAPSIDTSHIKVLRNGRWQPMYRPVNGDRFFSGTNLAESFAEKYAVKYGVVVGLIPCADGGTSLSQWKEGGLLYDHAIFQAKLASRASTIAGVLWHQGESDCGAKNCANYCERLIPVLTALRRDLGLDDVPFLLGGLGEYLARFGDADIRNNYVIVNQQLKQAAERMPMSAYVPSEGLESNPDNLHFNAAALYEFGHRYFDVFETIRKPDKVFLEKPCEDDALRTALESL